MLRRIALKLMLAMAASAAPAAELSDRRELIGQIHRLIVARDFAALDRMEQEFRDERSRTGSGVWKLDVFHGGLVYLGTLSEAPDCSDSADAILADWRRASPKSPAPIIASAQRMLDKAWCHRGSGYANEVDDTSWAPFHEHLDAAYRMLEDNKAIASADPQYYALMVSIYVAQGRDEEELQALLSEAMAREPYYYELYVSAFRYYEPQWFGDYDKEADLVRLAVQHTRAKDRASVAVRVYWAALECGCLPPVEALDTKLIRQGMNDLVALYPDAWNFAHMAKIACALDDGPLARHYFDALRPEDDSTTGWADWSTIDMKSWRACREKAGIKDPA